MTFSQLRFTLLAALVIAASPVLTGCGDDDDDDDTAGTDTSANTDTATGDDDDSTTDGTTPAGTAKVRALHGSPDAPAVDVYAGSTKLISNVSFGQLSGALVVPADTELTLDFRAAGADPSSAPAASAKVGPVPADSEWLAIATGFLSKSDAQKFQLQAVPVDFADDAANTRLVAVHSSPDAPAVDVLAATGEGDFQAIEGLTGLSFPGSSAAEGKQLPPDDYEIGIGAAGTTTPLVRYDITTAAGLRAYAVALGSLAPASESIKPFGLYLITAPATGPWTISLLTPKSDATDTTGGDDDDDTTGTTGTDGTGDDDTTGTTDTTGGDEVAFVSVFHAGADAPAVDIWEGDTRVVADLAFGGVNGPLEVPANTELDFEIFPASTSSTKPAGNPVYTFEAPALTAGTTTLAVATGLLGATGNEPAFSVQAYGADFTTSATGAALKLLHSSPDAPAVDIVALGASGYAPVQGLTALAFPQGTGLFELPAGAYQIGVAGSGTTTPLVEYDLALTAGQEGFLVAAGQLAPGEGGQPFTLFYIDTTGADWSAGTIAPIDAAAVATVYAFHGSPNAPAVDVYAGESKLISNLAFGEVTALPLRVPAGEYTLDFRAAGADPTSTPAASAGTGALAAGRTYIAIASGFLGDTGDTAFKLIGVALQAQPASSKTNALAVHASADAPAVDVQSGVTDLLANAAYGQSGLVGGGDLSADSYDLNIAAGGTEAALLNFTVDLTADYRYVVIAAGSFGNREGAEPFGLWALPFPAGGATLSAVEIALTPAGQP